MFERPLDRPYIDASAKLLDLDFIDSVALQRLIEEIRADPTQTLGATAYNRTYHRHNR
jgi:hypothetical protein